MVCTAAIIGAAAAYILDGWFLAVVLGTVTSQVVLYSALGLPRVTEMVLPLLYSLVPALLGAFAGATIRKRKGVS
jgi:hypothetical protein